MNNFRRINYEVNNQIVIVYIDDSNTDETLIKKGEYFDATN